MGKKYVARISVIVLALLASFLYGCRSFAVSNKSGGYEKHSSEEMSAGVRLGTYIPMSAKEADYQTGPLLGGYVRGGFLENVEFSLDTVYSKLEKADLEILDGYSNGDSILFLLKGNYIYCIADPGCNSELSLLVGGGLATENTKTISKYFNPPIGWEEETDTVSMTTPIINFGLKYLWSLEHGNGFEADLNLIIFPLSDNVSSSICFNVGYRF